MHNWILHRGVCCRTLQSVAVTEHISQYCCKGCNQNIGHHQHHRPVVWCFSSNSHSHWSVVRLLLLGIFNYCLLLSRITTVWLCWQNLSSLCCYGQLTTNNTEAYVILPRLINKLCYAYTTPPCALLSLTPVKAIIITHQAKKHLVSRDEYNIKFFKKFNVSFYKSNKLYYLLSLLYKQDTDISCAYLLTTKSNTSTPVSQPSSSLEIDLPSAKKPHSQLERMNTVDKIQLPMPHSTPTIHKLNKEDMKKANWWFEEPWSSSWFHDYLLTLVIVLNQLNYVPLHVAKLNHKSNMLWKFLCVEP